ncbi:MAG: OmpH family outer membrane protein [Endomicrobium sp.]|jgi:Skp family chaperone for outer membrane proteins|nr:OmpH family outer membrane protein [Endomicrobium sp.]
MFSKKFFLLVFCLIFISLKGFGLDEPLSVEVFNSVFCVDMDEIFNAYPKTLKYKNEIKEFAYKRKVIIEDLIKEFNKLKFKIETLESKISKAKLENNEVLVCELSKELESLLVILKEQSIKISDLSESSKKDISLLEQRYSAEVLKDIETLLKEFAKKYHVDTILDKKSVLFGKYKNITDEIVKDIKGK